MMFILRAIFWLVVVSAIMPSRAFETAEPFRTVTPGQVVDAAVGYCNATGASCVERALSAASSVRIPAEFLQRNVASVSLGGGHIHVPVPMARPATFASPAL